MLVNLMMKVKFLSYDTGIAADELRIKESSNGLVDIKMM